MCVRAAGGKRHHTSCALTAVFMEPAVRAVLAASDAMCVRDGEAGRAHAHTDTHTHTHSHTHTHTHTCAIALFMPMDQAVRAAFFLLAAVA
jgi:hypothetical protein